MNARTDLDLRAKLFRGLADRSRLALQEALSEVADHIRACERHEA